MRDLSLNDPKNVLICEKSDGVRYLLVHFYNEKVMLFNRKMEFYEVELDIKLPKSSNLISNSNRTNHSKQPYDVENFLPRRRKDSKVCEGRSANCASLRSIAPLCLSG